MFTFNWWVYSIIIIILVILGKHLSTARSTQCHSNSLNDHYKFRASTVGLLLRRWDCAVTVGLCYDCGTAGTVLALGLWDCATTVGLLGLCYNCGTVLWLWDCATTVGLCCDCGTVLRRWDCWDCYNCGTVLWLWDCATTAGLLGLC